MKEKETMTIFKVIFAWEDEKEENWLQEMAAKGWHLLMVAPFIYTFKHGAPEKVIYRLDYKLTLDKDYTEYEEIFRASKWELVAKLSNWHYYRITPENDIVPEIYNSNRTKAQKYRRVLIGLLPLLPIYIAVFNPLTQFFNRRNGDSGSVMYETVHILMFIIMLFFVYVTIRIILNIRNLETHSRE